METIFIKDGYINYYGEGEEIEITTEYKRKMEFENYKYINGEFIPPIKTNEEIKQEKISEYKKLETELSRIGKEIENTNFLPDGLVKTMKINKLSEEKITIETDYNNLLNTLITEYGEIILNEII